MAPARALPLFLLFSGCTLDWAVRADPSTSPLPADAGPDVADASVPPDGGADGDAGPDCFALAADMEQKRNSARRCTLASNHCQTTVKDQCDCDVVIAVGGSAATIAYESAVAALVASGCPRGCGASCPAIGTKSCLQNPSGTDCVP